MEKDRNTLVLYTTAVCNLKCVYCYIDKNPALKKIDDILDESFQGDYYFEFTKKMFPMRGQLRRIETWGGEPFLRMDRVYHTLHRLIGYYPYLETMHSSTNCAFPEWCDQFFGLMAQFGKYPERDFTYDLQLSLDGPEYITDHGRGRGTTKKFLENYHKLLQRVGTELPSNVTLNVHFKPTLDLDTTRMLCDKQRIIEYYQFFEQVLEPAFELPYSNVHFYLPVPNTACPSPNTQEDGRTFTEFCRLCREIEDENRKGAGYFKHYKGITPFAGRQCGYCRSMRHPHHTCGTGRTVIGLLPFNMISACHNGFVDIISDYKAQCTANGGESCLEFSAFLASQPTRMTMTLDEFARYEKQVEHYARMGTSARLANIVELIHMEAYAGHIDPKYKDPEQALDAGLFLQGHTAYCMRDNYNVTGSVAMYPLGMIRLLLNGAREYIEQKEVCACGR